MPERQPKTIRNQRAEEILAFQADRRRLIKGGLALVGITGILGFAAGYHKGHEQGVEDEKNLKLQKTVTPEATPASR